MDHRFLNDSGLPTVFLLQCAEAGLLAATLPFVVYRVCQYIRLSGPRVELSILALTLRKLAFYSSFLFTVTSLFQRSAADLPLTVLAAAATTLHYSDIQGQQSLPAPTELLLYWLAQALLSFFRLGSEPSALNVALTSLASITWLFELYSSPLNPTAYEEASVFGRMSMSFLQNMIDTARERTITEADFAGRPESIGMQRAYAQFLKTFDRTRPGNKHRVIWTLLTFYKWRLILLLSLRFVVDLISYTQPLLLSLFLRSLQEARNSGSLRFDSVYLALGLGLLSLILRSIDGMRMIHVNALYLNSRTSLMEAIYRKALVISSDTRHKFDSAKIMNLLNVDTSMVQTAFAQLSILISAPIGLALCTVQLYMFLGKATLAAVPLYVLYVPFSSWSTKQLLRRFPETMAAKDQRAKSTISVMRNIKSLKLYAWEDPYESRVIEDREHELSIQRKFLNIRVAYRTVSGQLDNLVVTAVFLAFLYLSGKPLTPEIAFPALSMVSLVSEPLFSLPSAVSELGAAFTSQQRILEFLEQPEEMFENYNREPSLAPDDFDTPMVVVDEALVTWGSASESPIAVQPLKLKLRRGDMCCIFGKVGVGKTAFLKALCSQLYIKKGSITLRGSIAYASQEPWLQFKTLRDNILFGLEFDEDFYNLVLKSCDLETDIAMFPNGDLTEIGEKGITLSGGQKARVSLARAVYSRADVYILDDILSAVDHHVSDKLLAELFATNGLLAFRVVVLATHTAKSLKIANHLMCMSRGGNVIYNGNPAGADTDELVSATGEDMNASSIKRLLPKQSFDRRQEVLHHRYDSNATTTTTTLVGKLDPSNTNATFAPRRFSEDEMLPDVPIMGVYKRYLQTVGIKIALFTLFLIVMSVCSVSMVPVWLTIWSDKELSGLKNSQLYVDVFLVIVVLAAAFNAAAYYTFFGSMALGVSQILHDRMIDNVIHAPMSFFERTPLGSVMSRFTGDIASLDVSLPQTMFFFLSMLMTTFSNLAIAIFGSPFLLVVLIPMFYKYNRFRKAFVPTSRQLQKLISASNGPLLSHIEESIRGVTTLTVMGCRDQFIQGFENRGDYWAHTSFLRFALRRWLNNRIAWMSATVATVSALSVVGLIRYTALPVGVAGIVLHSTRVAGSYLSRIISSWTQIEVSVVSVERIFDYIDLQNEAAYHLDPADEPHIEADWPAHGVIKFKDYSTKYRPELDDVLHKINLTIQNGEKIGVVGRTGAGKSTLTLALFRIVEATGGNIDIDSINTSELGLFDLRSRLSIIPQEAQIFKGTLRQNMDPLNTSDDVSLWRTLELCHLKDHFEHGLDTEIVEGGDNISRGQAQLICLGRALLRSTKILVLDEATASVDTNTDSFVQSTIRREFKDRTIVTIAHRLDTVLDSDKILVLSNGRIVEFDTPQKLLEQKGAFYELSKSHH